MIIGALLKKRERKKAKGAKTVTLAVHVETAGRQVLR